MTELEKQQQAEVWRKRVLELEAKYQARKREWENGQTLELTEQEREAERLGWASDL